MIVASSRIPGKNQFAITVMFYVKSVYSGLAITTNDDDNDMERSRDLQEARNVADRWLLKAAEYGLSAYSSYSSILAFRFGPSEEQTRDEIHCCRASESKCRSGESRSNVSADSSSRSRESISNASADSDIADISNMQSFDSASVSLETRVDLNLETEVSMAFSDLTLDANSICSLLSNERDDSMDDYSFGDVSLGRKTSTINSKSLNKSRVSQEPGEEIDFHPNRSVNVKEDLTVNPTMGNTTIFSEVTTPKITNRAYVD